MKMRGGQMGLLDEAFLTPRRSEGDVQQHFSDIISWGGLHGAVWYMKSKARNDPTSARLVYFHARRTYLATRLRKI